MSYGGEDTKRRPDGFATLLTRLFETLGLLNKGSATTPAAPDSGEADMVQPVSSNALNVTRVTGIGSVIAGAGAAALAIFDVHKGTDATAIVVAAYGAVGLIVAAALVTVAIIVSADIRARQAIAIATSAAKPEEHVDILTRQGALQTEVKVDRAAVVEHAAADGSSAA